MKRRGLFVLLVILLFSAGAVGVAPAAGVKNVILMITDGGGFNCFEAASMFEGRWDARSQRSREVFDQPGWTHLACSTYPRNTSKTALGTNEQDPSLVYDPLKAWDPREGYAWLIAGYTDSAAAATALSTGRKTYTSAINWSDKNRPLLPTLGEAAKATGRAAGVITSVQWSHGTPAGLGIAHNVKRYNYVEIANEMLQRGVLDVIMGAGNPEFNPNGQPREANERDYRYVGGQDNWKAIEAARAVPDGYYLGYRPVSTKAEFEALTSGPTPPKVLGTAQVAATLQQSRRPLDAYDASKDAPLNSNVPSLATMTRAALNVLDENPNGFYLMIEGGAVDWANHGNQPTRMIQEQVDFHHAIEAVVQWVKRHGGWSETLLVITADHETGLIWGPNSDTTAFEPLEDRGPGVVPGMKYHSKSHTNSLVPLRVRGAGSQAFCRLAVGRDDPVRGAYVTNTDVAAVLHEALGPRGWDFEDTAVETLPPGWGDVNSGKHVGGAWRVLEDPDAFEGDKVLAPVSSDAAEGSSNLCMVENMALRDVDVTVSLKAIDTESNHGGGLVWRYQDADSYYVARLNPLEDRLHVEKVVDGKREELVSSDVAARAGAWRRLQVIHVGDRICCYVDGKLRADVEDTSLGELGNVGLWAEASDVAAFDAMVARGVETAELRSGGATPRCRVRRGMSPLRSR